MGQGRVRKMDVQTNTGHREIDQQTTLRLRTFQSIGVFINICSIVYDPKLPPPPTAMTMMMSHILSLSVLGGMK